MSRKQKKSSNGQQSTGLKERKKEKRSPSKNSDEASKMKQALASKKKFVTLVGCRYNNQNKGRWVSSSKTQKKHERYSTKCRKTSSRSLPLIPSDQITQPRLPKRKIRLEARPTHERRPPTPSGLGLRLGGWCAARNRCRSRRGRRRRCTGARASARRMGEGRS